MPQRPTLEALRQKALDAGAVFTPAAPIDERSLFAGRDLQMRQVVDAINQKGRHAIIFGERGVGKTSLANVLSSFLAQQTLAVRVNCDGQDTFESLWRKVFEKVELEKPIPSAGFIPSQRTTSLSWSSVHLPPPDEHQPVTTDHIRRGLTQLAATTLPIVIVDEFDRLPRPAKQTFADAIKTLSDHAVAATVVMVGVADSVDHLIEEHQSVERALVQVRMPRMSPGEIEEIVKRGVRILGMTIAEKATQRIVLLSQGLPHYTHLLSLHSVRTALDSRSLEITDSHVETAIKTALGEAEHSIQSLYHKALLSPRKDNLFPAVLLSCALAHADELGFFAAQDVREPMRDITGKKYEIPSFSQHLNEFLEEKRGTVLQRTGTRRRFKFRFRNPLLQPYVIMRGIDEGRLSPSVLDKFRGNRKSHTNP
jgi:Cdc6-like AAA superfamily ATPase